MKKYLMIVLGAVVAGSFGCRTADDLTWYRDFYNRHCEDMAWNYRHGDYGRADLQDMEVYFRSRMGKMTVAELKETLGEPRVVPPEDSYYRNALAPLYGWEIVDNADWKGGTKHDLVLHYGEDGPPHWISDESSNLFFVAKNGVVVSMWCLFP